MTYIHKIQKKIDWWLSSHEITFSCKDMDFVLHPNVFHLQPLSVLVSCGIKARLVSRGRGVGRTPWKIFSPRRSKMTIDLGHFSMFRPLKIFRPQKLFRPSVKLLQENVNETDLLCNNKDNNIRLSCHWKDENNHLLIFLNHCYFYYPVIVSNVTLIFQVKYSSHFSWRENHRHKIWDLRKHVHGEF